MIASTGLAPAFNVPAAIASGRPSTGINVGNGNRWLASRRDTPTLPLVLAHHENVRIAITVPIRHREVRDACKRRKRFRARKRTVFCWK